jgi:molybdenum cofactor guanylyltransferase
MVLAGGAGTRMGGLDKGLQLLRGRSLVERVLARLAPQVDEILISANRNLEAYGRFGYRVVHDEQRNANDAFDGPLAGLQASCRAAAHSWILTAPCDAPDLPRNLGSRLRRGLAAQRALCAVATVGGMRQPVFSLFSRDLAPQLDDYLAGGGRSVNGWQRSVHAIEVPFDDEPAAFAPLNTLQALAARETSDG